MPCDVPAVSDPAKAPKRCKCYRAVMRTYDELLQDRVPDEIALEAAQRVYRFHHPEDTLSEANLIVERWVQQGHYQ